MKPAIAMIPETAWTTIEYTDAIFDDSTNTWTSPTEEHRWIEACATSDTGLHEELLPD